jgi:hypothetical protein
MAIARCGQCSIPFLREEIVASRCPACGAPLNAPAATARISAPVADPTPDDSRTLRRSLLLAVLMPLILAAGLYFAFRGHFGGSAGVPPTEADGPIASVPSDIPADQPAR